MQRCNLSENLVGQPSPAQRPDPEIVPDVRPALPGISDNVTKLLGKLIIIAHDPVEPGRAYSAIKVQRHSRGGTGEDARASSHSSPLGSSGQAIGRDACPTNFQPPDSDAADRAHCTKCRNSSHRLEPVLNG